MIRLLLVDDQDLICQGLKAMLSLEADLEIIGTANNGQVALDQSCGGRFRIPRITE